jgi:hypothetical protein
MASLDSGVSQGTFEESLCWNPCIVVGSPGNESLRFNPIKEFPRGGFGKANQVGNPLLGWDAPGLGVVVPQLGQVFFVAIGGRHDLV